MTLARSFYSTQTTAYDYLQARAPREMWSAVLKQAIEDAVNGPQDLELRDMHDPHQREWFKLAVRTAAQDWLADEENEPRRFRWVCEQLGLDPNAVRRAVERRKNPPPLPIHL